MVDLNGIDSLSHKVSETPAFPAVEEHASACLCIYIYTAELLLLITYRVKQCMAGETLQGRAAAAPRH